MLLLQLGKASLALYSAVDPQARRAARCNTRPDAAQHVSDTLRRPLLSSFSGEVGSLSIRVRPKTCLLCDVRATSRFFFF